MISRVTDFCMSLIQHIIYYKKIVQCYLHVAIYQWFLQETIHKHEFPEKGAKIVKALSPAEDGDQDTLRKKSLVENRAWMSTMVPYCFFGLHETAYSEVIYHAVFRNS